MFALATIDLAAPVTITFRGGRRASSRTFSRLELCFDFVPAFRLVFAQIAGIPTRRGLHCRPPGPVSRPGRRDFSSWRVPVSLTVFPKHLATFSKTFWRVPPESYRRANVDGTVRLLAFCRAAGIPRFVFASSSSVYGPETPLPAREDGPVDPCSPYALTKLQGEQWGRLHARLWGLRFFSVWEPRILFPNGPAGAMKKV